MDITEKHDNSEIKAECTWGDGPDVLISIKNHPILLGNDVVDKHKSTHGIVKDSWIDLTQAQARKLAHDLLIAADQAKYLEDSIKDYCNNQSKKES